MRLSHRTVLIVFVLSVTTACNVERDQQDALAVASRVHSQMQVGDFAVIYRDAAPRFKSVGSESEFVSRMQKFVSEYGKFVKAQEVAYQSGLDSQAGRTHTLSFKVQYERGQGLERLIFTRSNNGQMQLWRLEVE
jgi:hypothetical protein